MIMSLPFVSTPYNARSHDLDISISSQYSQEVEDGELSVIVCWGGYVLYRTKPELSREHTLCAASDLHPALICTSSMRVC